MVRLFHSKNMSSADKQQERLRIENWIVGFTDGEGCFSVSFIRNKSTKNGWQVFPEFVITQGKKSLPTLKIFKKYFKCGSIFVNRRKDNHKENLYRFCVRSCKDLQEIIIPFFRKNRLKTFKYKDFRLFSIAVEKIASGKHLTDSGAKEIAKIVEKMNRKKKSQFLESSETKRQTR